MKHRVVHTSVNSNLNVPLGQTVTPLSATVLTTDYVSNLVYEDGDLKYILNPEGYAVRRSTGDYSYNYYLKDHLGNNRVVLEIDRVNSLVNQATDYYPFGMPYADSQYPERQPYKFGGKEYDEMHGLNWYDFHARAYNGILGHFPTIPDPLAEKYYWISPYAYCNNNPVNAYDLHGDSITTVINTTITNPNGSTSIQSNTYYYGQDANGNYGFIDNNGQIYSGNNTYVNNLTTALNSLRTGGNAGNALVGDLINSTKTVQIAQGSNAADPNGTYIKWNPNSTTGGTDQNGGTTRPSYIGLGHEMAHIQDVWNGTYDASTWATVTDANGNLKNIPNAEKYSTHVENQLRAENNIPLRTHYDIPGTNATRILINNTNQSRFYRRTITIQGISVSTTPYI